MKTMTSLTSEQVLELLREKQGNKNNREFSIYVGCSPSYLSELYKGTREPAGKILDWMGLERVNVYRKKNKA